MLNPFVAPVVLPVNRQHHFRSTALETSTSAQLPPKSPGCTDSAGLVFRRTAISSLWSVRPYRRDQPSETVPPPRLSPPDCRQSRQSGYPFQRLWLYLWLDKSEFIGVIQALAFLMECQGFAVKREQTAGEARKVQANSFKFINQIVRKILSL